MIDLSKIDVVILCGGLGTRIRNVTNDKIPKCLIDINGTPFLKRLVLHLMDQGFRRFIFCTGHKGVEVAQYAHNMLPEKCEKIISHEQIPLGTGGAVWKAMRFIKSEYFFIMNGDTFCSVDFKIFVRQSIYKLERGVAVGLGVLVNGLDTINSGIYFANNVALYSELNDWGKRSSLEKEVFPPLIGTPCYDFEVADEENIFIDIGTLEGCTKALDYFK